MKKKSTFHKFKKLKKEASLKSSIRKLIECPICFEVFINPITLCCGHTVCMKCIKGILGDKKDNLIKCPLCAADSFISSQPTNVTIRDICEIITGTKQPKFELLNPQHHESIDADKLKKEIHEKCVSELLDFIEKTMIAYMQKNNCTSSWTELKDATIDETNCTHQICNCGCGYCCCKRSRIYQYLKVESIRNDLNEFLQKRGFNPIGYEYSKERPDKISKITLSIK
jgi:hypothetical protein